MFHDLLRLLWQGKAEWQSGIGKHLRQERVTKEDVAFSWSALDPKQGQELMHSHLSLLEQSQQRTWHQCIQQGFLQICLFGHVVVSHCCVQ